MLRNPTIQRILKSTSIYTAGNFINRAIPFILLPILTRFLCPEDYGILAIFIAVLGIIEIVISMGVADAVVRNYLDREVRGFEFSAYVFNAFLINLLFFSIITAFWLLSKAYLIKIIPIPFNYQLLIPLFGFLISVQTIPMRLLIMMKRPLPYITSHILVTSVEFILSVFFVVVLGLTWQGRIGGIFLSKILFFIIGMAILGKYKFFRCSLNLSYIKDILRYSSPIVLHSLGFVIIAAIDRFFLSKFINLSTVGIYSVSYSACSIVAFFTLAFRQAISPFIYEKLKQPTLNLKIKLVKSTYLYFALMLAGMGLFIYFAPPLLNILVGKQFLGAKVFIFWLALGFGFHAMYTMLTQYIFYQKKTHILSLVALFTVILTIAANYVLIKINGAIGVAQATCLVFLSRFLLVWYFSNRVYPMPWFSFARIKA